MEADLAKVLADLEAQGAKKQHRLSEIKKQTATLTATEQNLQHSKQAILDLQVKTQEQIKKRGEAKSQRQQFHALKTKLETDLAQSKKEEADLECERSTTLAAEKKQVEAHEAQAKRMEAAQAQREAEVGKLQEEQKQLSKLLTELNEGREFQELETQRDELRSSLEAAESRLRDERKKEQEMQGQVVTLQAQADEQTAALDAELLTLRTDQAKLRKDMQDLQEQHDALEKESATNAQQQEAQTRKLQVLRRGAALLTQTKEEERQLTEDV